MSDEEKPPAWAIDLRDAFTTSISGLTEKVDALSTTVDTLTHDAKDTRLRLGRIEREQDELKNRQGTNSMRVEAESKANLEQDAAIALLHEKVDKLTAIGERLEKLAGNPTVKKVGQALAFAILGWLATKGYIHQ